jgi:hypothetical protein
MVVHFVDIGGIVEHPFVNFLVIVIKIVSVTYIQAQREHEVLKAIHDLPPGL